MSVDIAAKAQVKPRQRNRSSSAFRPRRPTPSSSTPEQAMSDSASPVASSAADAVPRPDRFSVSLSPRTVADLQTLKERTGMPKTDIINRGIGLYAFVQQQIAAGQELLLRGPDGSIQLVRFL